MRFRNIVFVIDVEKILVDVSQHAEHLLAKDT
jgi:hypothetical protein